MSRFIKQSVFLYTLTVLAAVSLLLTSCGQQTEETTGPTSVNGLQLDPDNGGINLPEGLGAFVVAEDLGRGRHVTVRDNGDIYIALRQMNNGGGIVALRDTTGDGRADIKAYFGDVGGTGMQIHNGYLYFASDLTVYRYEMDANELVPPGEPEVIASGFPEQGSHAVKPFTFDNQGHIYVNVGAPSNACQEQARTQGSPGMDPCPQLEQQGGIWRFQADGLNQDQMEDGYRFATGIRNAVALDWNPLANQLYVAMHGRDQLHELFPDMFTVEDNAQLPAEELFLVNDGDNFGWPYAYYDHLQGEKVLAPEYGGDGMTVGRAAEFEDPIMAFPGHWAPNDLLFYTGDMFPEEYHGGAFIAWHGSWNRAPLPQAGYNVTFTPFDGEKPSGAYEIFADGFPGTETIESTGDAQYRPCGLAEGPDGSLYIVDSNEGKTWRVLPKRM
jgi:glucose/arabinose dehydrogenase